MSDFKTPQWNGSAFDHGTGKFYDFAQDQIRVLRYFDSDGNDSPLAWVKSRTVPTWGFFRPNVRLVENPAGLIVSLSQHPKSRQLAFDFFVDPLFKARVRWARFCQQIPAILRHQIAPFPERHWHLLSLLARVKEAAERVEQSPLLAFAIASNWVFHKTSAPMRTARRLCQKRHRTIAEYLGFPASKRAVKILRKVPSGSASVSHALWLRTALTTGGSEERKKVVRFLSHTTVINADVVRLVCNSSLVNHISPNFLDDVAAKKSARTFFAYQLSEMLSLHRYIRPSSTLPIIRNTEHFERLRWDLVDMINDAGGLEALELTFPPAPFQDDPAIGIFAIHNQRDLLSWAIKLKNCAARLGVQVMDENLFIYKLAKPAPQNAMFSVRKRYEKWARPPAATWQLGPIALACNKKPSELTRTIVHRWLRDRRREKKRSS